MQKEWYSSLSPPVDYQHVENGRECPVMLKYKNPVHKEVSHKIPKTKTNTLAHGQGQDQDLIDFATGFVNMARLGSVLSKHQAPLERHKSKDMRARQYALVQDAWKDMEEENEYKTRLIGGSSVSIKEANVQLRNAMLEKAGKVINEYLNGTDCHLSIMPH